MRASNKVKGAVLLTAGAALILGAPTVYADTNTGHNDGLLSGVSLLNGATVNLPVNVAGVGALLGSGSGKAHSTAGNDNAVSLGKNSVGKAKAGSQGDVSTGHNDGLLSGLSVGNNLSVNAPINACGVGALLAKGKGQCSSSAGNGNATATGKGGKASAKAGSQGDVSSKNNDGVLTGASLLNNASVNAPVNVCGVGLLVASGAGKCSSAAGNGNATSLGGGKAGTATAGNGGNVSTGNNDGLLNGLSALNNLEANAPVTVCGLAVLGSAKCEVEVSAGNRNAVVKGVSYHRHHRYVDAESLPHTGAAGLALIPFGLALVAGGAAMRRRITSQR